MEKQKHLINPTNATNQQNININISYNLNTNQLPKSLLGKKLTHHNKVKNNHSPLIRQDQFLHDYKALMKSKNETGKFQVGRSKKQPVNPIDKGKKQTNKKLTTGNDKRPITADSILKLSTKSKKKKSTHGPSTKQYNITKQHQKSRSHQKNPSKSNNKNKILLLDRNVESPDIFSTTTNGNKSNYHNLVGNNSQSFNKKRHKTHKTQESIMKVDTFNNYLGGGNEVEQQDDNFMVGEMGNNKRNYNSVGNGNGLNINLIDGRFYGYDRDQQPLLLKKPTSKTPKSRKQPTKSSNLWQNIIVKQNKIFGKSNKTGDMTTSNKKQKRRRIHTQQNQRNYQPFFLPKNHNDDNQALRPSIKKNHNKSCTLQNNTHSKMYNEKKLITKLIDMSVLEEELGSSQFINSSSDRMDSRLGSGRLGSGRLGSGRRNTVTGARRLPFRMVDEVDGRWVFQGNMHEMRASQEQLGDKGRKQKRSSKDLKGQSECDDEKKPGTALRQFLNSIDMRMIQNIQKDKQQIQHQNILQLKYNNYLMQHQENNRNQGLVQSNKRISFQSEQAQYSSEKIIQPDVVSYYNKLFHNVLYETNKHQPNQQYLNQSKKFGSMNKLVRKQIFSIDLSESYGEDTVRLEGKKVGQGQGPSQEVNRGQLIVGQLEQFEKGGKKHVNKSRCGKQNVEQSEKGNFQQSQHQYQQQISHQQPISLLQSNSKPKFTLHRSPTQQQSSNQSKQLQWNKVNKILNDQIIMMANSSQLDQKSKGQMERKMMQQLIKQSEENRKWIQQQPQQKEQNHQCSEKRQQKLSQWGKNAQNKQQETSKEYRLDLGRLSSRQKSNQRQKGYQKQEKLQENTEQKIMYIMEVNTPSNKDSVSHRQTNINKKHRRIRSGSGEIDYQFNQAEVCWEYDPEQVQKQFKQGQKQQKLADKQCKQGGSQYKMGQKQLKQVTKKLKPTKTSFQSYIEQPNQINSVIHPAINISLHNNNNNDQQEKSLQQLQEQYDSKKYSISSQLFLLETQNHSGDYIDQEQQLEDRPQLWENHVKDGIENMHVHEDLRVTVKGDKQHQSGTFKEQNPNKQQHTQNQQCQQLKGEQYGSFKSSLQSQKTGSKKLKNFHQLQIVKQTQQPQEYLQCELGNFGLNQRNQLTNGQSQQKQFFDDQNIGFSARQCVDLQSQVKQPQHLRQKDSQSSESKIKLDEAIQIIQAEEEDFSQLLNRHQQNKKSAGQAGHSTAHNTSITQNDEQFFSQISPVKDEFLQLKRKRLEHIIEYIVLQMIKQFAHDISQILKKSSSPQQPYIHDSQDNLSNNYHIGEEQLSDEDVLSFGKINEHIAIKTTSVKDNHQDNNEANYQRCEQNGGRKKKENFMGRHFGVETGYRSIEKYLKEFKEFILARKDIIQAILTNINKDIGPNSLEILSYLRPDYDDQPQGALKMGATSPNNPNNMDQVDEDDQDGLFVIPSDTFQNFEDYLEAQRQKHNQSPSTAQGEKISYTNRQKAYLNFWHRSIFESFNEFLDYERPYGINGKPYDWIRQGKKFHKITEQSLPKKLSKSIEKLLQSINLPSGIIYDKFNILPIYTDLNEDQKLILNEERLSRMLAIELFESQQTWINYNDQIAELLVEMSRMIEEKIFFELTVDIKKVIRRKRDIGGANVGQRLQTIVGENAGRERKAFEQGSPIRHVNEQI